MVYTINEELSQHLKELDHYDKNGKLTEDAKFSDNANLFSIPVLDLICTSSFDLLTRGQSNETSIENGNVYLSA